MWSWYLRLSSPWFSRAVQHISVAVYYRQGKWCWPIFTYLAFTLLLHSEWQYCSYAVHRILQLYWYVQLSVRQLVRPYRSSSCDCSCSACSYHCARWLGLKFYPCQYQSQNLTQWTHWRLVSAQVHGQRTSVVISRMQQVLNICIVCKIKLNSFLSSLNVTSYFQFWFLHALTSDCWLCIFAS